SKRGKRPLLIEQQFVVRPDDLAGAPAERRDADQGPGDARSAVMAEGGEQAGGRRDKGHDGLADVVEPLGGRRTAPAESQPGSEKHRKDCPSAEHDQEAAVTCHVGSVAYQTQPKYPPPACGAGRVGTYRPASPTVTAISFTSP